MEAQAVFNDQTGERIETVEEAPFYCPGCGRRWLYLTDCQGRGEAPHPPILVVSTDELAGDAAGHTAAPNTGT